MLKSDTRPLKITGKGKVKKLTKDLGNQKIEAKVGEESITKKEKDKAEIDRETQVSQDANVTTSITFNSTKKYELLNQLDWESLELKYWGQHNL